jgi:hypothetical protein
VTCNVGDVDEKTLHYASQCRQNAQASNKCDAERRRKIDRANFLIFIDYEEFTEEKTYAKD